MSDFEQNRDRELTIAKSAMNAVSVFLGVFAGALVVGTVAGAVESRSRTRLNDAATAAVERGDASVNVNIDTTPRY